MNARLILGRLALVLTVPTLNSQLSTLFAQGSLAPPGAPAPTMKTLDQIEPRTPISSLPFLITNPGSYYLTTNLIGSGTDNGIIIQGSRSDVTVDLNGFALTGGSTSGNGITALALPATTINAGNHYAYGANFGWMDCRGDTSNGAVIGEYVCSGYLLAANVGWISLGSGSPTNGIYYQNLSANDFGVNQDGLGNLRGYAWGANIGWINFENLGAPRVDLVTGNLTGYVYSANCGWIGLSNAFALVQTDTIRTGADSDGDGIADAWELTHTNALTAFTASSDTDGDGVSDLLEYLADTNPNDGNDYLRITDYATAPGGTTNAVTWSSTPTRLYYLQRTLGLDSSPWLDSGLVVISPDGATTTRGVADTNAPIRFYRVEAIRALSP